MPSTELRTDLLSTNEIEASQNSSLTDQVFANKQVSIRLPSDVLTGDALSKTSVPKSSFVSPVFPLSGNGSAFDVAASQHPEVSHQQVECSHAVSACDNNEQASDGQRSEESVFPVPAEPYVESPRKYGGFVEVENGMGMPATDLSLAENSSANSSMDQHSSSSNTGDSADRAESSSHTSIPSELDMISAKLLVQ
ncbi:hypothetical protein V6N12_057535 [Hibiscus sabdariffa]|uniref:Uncharacterized protein n=1 Tax=Hibiscus sabdariffa TaxID=183260 RepID=A0ABR2C5E4_9ROSI